MKADGVSKRPLSIPSYTDRCLQSLYKLAFEPLAEEQADASSFRFRPIRSTMWACGKVMSAIINPTAKYRYALELDIKGCYDNIDHNFLMQHVPLVPKTILWSWLKCGYLDREKVNHGVLAADSGVPQGGIISPVFANFTLDGLERVLKNTIGRGNFIRYADDIVIFYKDRSQVDLALDTINKYLSLRGLNINDAKTKITDLEDNGVVTFVGFEFSRAFRKNMKRKVPKCNIPLKAKRNYQASIRKVSKEINIMNNFVEKVNQIISGWAGYYRFAHDSPYVFKALSFWTRKQYYKKAFIKVKNRFDKGLATDINNEVRSKYFSQYGNIKEWPTVFDGKGKTYRLYNMEEYFHISPTFTLKAKNAYIFEDRVILDNVSNRMKHSLRGKVVNRWNNCCAMCNKSLTINEIPYELHHILPKRFGGKDTVSNFVPLCREPCHQSISSAMLRKDGDSISKFINQGLLSIPQENLNN